MRAGDMVWLHERFDRGLPVAVEDHPLAPLVAHLPELERIEETGGGLEVFAQRNAAAIHVDEDPTTPRIDPDFVQARALIRQLAFPVRLVELERALAVQVVAPAMESADKLLLAAAGAVRALGTAHQLTAAMGTNIVVRLDR